MINGSVVYRALLAKVDNVGAPIVVFAGEECFLQPKLNCVNFPATICTACHDTNCICVNIKTN